jgi:hypothetical protein
MCAGTPNSNNADRDGLARNLQTVRCAGLAPLADYLNR